MTNLELLEIQGLQIAVAKTQVLLEQVLEKQSKQEAAAAVCLGQLSEWLTLRQAVELKGAGTYNTYKCNAKLQPLCGIAEGKVCGLKAWRKATILEWLHITDAELERYQKASFEKMGRSINKVAQ